MYAFIVNVTSGWRMYAGLDEEGIFGVIGSVTVKDVARQAEVSVGTVSRVFNNHSNVTDEIRSRVLKAAAELGYSRAVSQEPPRNSVRAIKEVGFLFCSFLDQQPDQRAATSNPFWSRILNGVESEARKDNIKVTYRTISDLEQAPQELFSTIQEMRLGGILLVGPAERETVQLLKQLAIPMVLVDNHMPGLSVDSVLCDNFEGARQAMTHLIALGHRRIAFIGGPMLPGPRLTNKVYTIERRSAGYRTALLDAGLQVDYALIEASNLQADGAFEACRRLLTSGVAFTAIFCASDAIAIGALKALREAGRRVPEDVSLVGFDDLTLVEHLTPALTTIRVNTEALGMIALQRLLARAADPAMISVSSVLEVELMQRASVGQCHS